MTMKQSRYKSNSIGERHDTRPNDSADDRIVNALEDYLARCDAGNPPDRDAFLKEYSDIAESLRLAIDGLDFVNDAAPRLEDQSTKNDSEDAEKTLPTRLGDFAIVHEIGRGGMGVVYEAQQLLLGRRVALKVLPLAAMLDERQRVRFENEAKAAATLNHPNIVPIHSVGVERGVHFYAMQLVEGESLAELICRLSAPDEHANHDDETQPEVQAMLTTQRSNSPNEYVQSVAKIGLQIAQALEHAHQHGIIHRDVKPSNVLLDARTGAALLTDFGLARVETSPTITMTGDVVGTLRYSAPEQVLGKRHIVDERVDIYSLGATLFELLTLTPIRTSDDRETVLQQAASGRVSSIRSLMPSIPNDLAVIVEKCLEASPEDRYVSTEELIEDLQRFSAGKTVKARRPSTFKRSARWVRRHPSGVLIALIAMVLFVAGAAAASLLLSQERNRTAMERDRASVQRDRAAENLRLAIATLDEFSEISDKLISTDGEVSNTQAMFLQRSANRLSEIARGLEAEQTMQAEAGLAFLRSANAYLRIHQYSGAEAGYQKAIELLRRATNDGRESPALIMSLATAEGALGQLYRELGNLPPARDQLNNALQHFDESVSLQVQSPKTKAQLEEQMGLFLEWQIELVAIDVLELRDEEVLDRTNEIQLQLDKLVAKNPDLFPANMALLRIANLGAKSLLRMARAEEAAALCQEAMTKTAFALQDFPDHRDVTRHKASVRAELGKSQAARGQYKQAEENLRAAMSQLLRSLVFDGTPAEFSRAYLLHDVTHDKMEPQAFADYARMQSALSQVLHKRGDTKEAYDLAVESVRVSVTLFNLFPKLPRFAHDLAICGQTLAAIPETQETTPTPLRWLAMVAERVAAVRSPPPTMQQAIAAFEAEYARCLHRHGKTEQALEHCSSAVAIQRAIETGTTDEGRLQTYQQLYSMLSNFQN